MKNLLVALLSAALLSALPSYSQSSPTKKVSFKSHFSTFAKQYVTVRINAWQQKGEFEKTSDYKARITGQRDLKVKEYTDDARREFIANTTPADIKSELKLGDYNADAEIYTLHHQRFGTIPLPVSISEAPEFKSSTWASLIAEPHYIIENDAVALADITFTQDSDNRKKKKKNKNPKIYIAKRADANYLEEEEIAFNFDPIEIEPENIVDTPAPAIAARQPRKGSSEIDSNIPTGIRTDNKNTFAVIISNEKYRRVANVDFAHNDGKVMRSYLSTTLGIPDDNIHFVPDATLNDMRAEIEWMQNVGKAYNGEASFVFYYSGHGMPDEATQAGHLLPVDGYASNPSTALAMSDLNKELAKAPSKLTLVLLDACFSGAMRDDNMLIAARGVKLKAKAGAIRSGNIVVMSASKDDETATKIDEEGHGLFTYFLLKKLRESKGNISLGELSQYVTTSVNRQSVVRNSKSQTPTVMTSPALASNWSKINISNLGK